MVVFKVEEVDGINYRVFSDDVSLPVGYLIYAWENDEFDYLYEFKIEKDGTTLLHNESVFVYDAALHWLGEALCQSIGQVVEIDEG